MNQVVWKNLLLDVQWLKGIFLLILSQFFHHVYLLREQLQITRERDNGASPFLSWVLYLSQYAVLVPFLACYLREELSYFLSKLIARVQRPCLIINFLISALVFVPNHALILFLRLFLTEIVFPSHFGELFIDLLIQSLLEHRQIVIQWLFLYWNSCWFGSILFHLLFK